MVRQCGVALIQPVVVWFELVQVSWETKLFICKLKWCVCYFLSLFCHFGVGKPIVYCWLYLESWGVGPYLLPMC